LSGDLGKKVKCTRVEVKNRRGDRWKITVEGGPKVKEYFEAEIPKAIIRRRINRYGERVR
jgi:hypothetical protein